MATGQLNLKFIIIDATSIFSKIEQILDLITKHPSILSKQTLFL